MRKILGIMALAAMLFMGVSCKPAPSLTVSPAACEVSAEGGPQEFTVSANYAWTAESDADWIRVSTKSGTKDDNLLKIVVSGNTLPDPREGTLTVTSESAVQTIRIVQSQKNMVVPVEGTEITFGNEAQVVDITVNTNVDFETEVSSSDSWLKVIGTKGLKSSTVTVSLEENETFSAREATLKFTCNGSAVSEIYVKQQGRPQTFVVIHENPSFKAPEVFGFGMEATVFWGDGSSEVYDQDLIHDYESDGPFELRIEATQASTVGLSNFVGVRKVDLSQF